MVEVTMCDPCTDQSLPGSQFYVFLTCSTLRVTRMYTSCSFLLMFLFFNDGSCGTEFRINMIIEIGKQKNLVLEQESIRLSD